MPERPGHSEIIGDVLSDPGFILTNFELAQGGHHDMASYAEWVQSQAQKVREEQERRRMHPNFSLVVTEEHSWSPDIVVQEADMGPGQTLIRLQHEEKINGGVESVTADFVYKGKKLFYASGRYEKGVLQGDDKFTVTTTLSVVFEDGKIRYNYAHNQGQDGEMVLKTETSE